jgi:hypothetical protein
MYAIVRQYRYDAAERAAAHQAAGKSQELHAAQPGYVGSVVIDDGQTLTAVNSWDTEQAAAAGRQAIGEQVGRLLEPHAVGPSELTAVGEVVRSDLGSVRSARSEPAERRNS